MLHREIPFIRICVPLCCGIVTSFYINLHVGYIVSLVVISAGTYLLSIRFNRKPENYFYSLPVSLCFYTLGIILYAQEKQSLTRLPQDPSVFICTLSDYPEQKAGSKMMKLKLHQKKYEDENTVIKGSILIYLKDSIQERDFIPGDRIILRCIPQEIKNRGNPYEFNYKFYMENLGFRYMAYITGSDILSHYNPDRRKFIYKALIIRRRIIEMYSERGITNDMLPLVSALTLGEKSMLDNDQKEIFIKAGIMHIMAVSGLHAVLLSMFVLNVLFFLKRRFNLLRIIIAVLFLWLFAFVTGLTPSVLRATLMFTFLQAGNLMHRRVNGINSVLASAFVLILIRPSVVFDAGFLLSYSAVIFIIAFYRSFYDLLHPGNIISDWLWQSASVTIVAQLGTLPLTIMLFNRFPVWFILTNIIIVPLSSLAIILGCLIPVFYPIPLISGTIGFLLDRLTFLTEELTRIAANLPLASLTGIGMTTSSCILMFSLIFAVMIFIRNRGKLNLIGALSFLLLLMISSTVNTFKLKTTGELIVYNTKGKGTIGIRTGKTLNIYADTILLSPEISRHSSVAGLKVIYHPLKQRLMLLDAGGTKIYFSEIKKGDKAVKSLPYNDPGVPVKTIITPGYRISVMNKDEKGIHYIRKSGAYTCRL
ncbi:MAG TPA: ComEC/Rec2 family competence protein [Bacteroidales bacterium]|nr:ComEC/Rec2 family competence protein [Bacteroidales bacterium]